MHTLDIASFLVVVATASVGCVSESDRRAREIAEFDVIAAKLRATPTDSEAWQELLSYRHRHQDWDRTQMLAQIAGLGRSVLPRSEVRPIFESIVIPVVRDGLLDQSGFVRRISPRTH